MAIHTNKTCESTTNENESVMKDVPFFPCANVIYPINIIMRRKTLTAAVVWSKSVACSCISAIVCRWQACKDVSVTKGKDSCSVYEETYTKLYTIQTPLHCTCKSMIESLHHSWMPMNLIRICYNIFNQTYTNSPTVSRLIFTRQSHGAVENMTSTNNHLNHVT